MGVFWDDLARVFLLERLHGLKTSDRLFMIHIKIIQLSDRETHKKELTKKYLKA